jgi:hypothetical protein
MSQEASQRFARESMPGQLACSGDARAQDEQHQRGHRGVVHARAGKEQPGARSCFVAKRHGAAECCSRRRSQVIGAPREHPGGGRPHRR